MKIIVTDGFTLNSGDLDWKMIADHGDLTVYDRTPRHLVEERCRDAQIVLTNKTPFDGDMLGRLPRLQCISVLATGYNVIDTAAAAAQGVVVCNVPGYGTASVAQHVFALLLELTNAAFLHAQSVRRGEWQQSPDWCYTRQPMLELHGKTMGIVGLGNIGRQVARIAAAFGMKIIYYNHRQKPSDLGQQVSMADLFRQSDVVSLHCPLTDANRQMVNEVLLRTMKPSAYLINTARGGLVNEAHLTAALNDGVIAAAALDVLENEPPGDQQTALMAAKNCLITPHNAWMSREARQRIMEITAGNIKAFLEKKPVNRVA